MPDHECQFVVSHEDYCCGQTAYRCTICGIVEYRE